MPETVQRGIENLISKRANDLRQLKFSWFGGEPLLALDVILRLSSFATKVAKDHGFSFGGGLITNAYLLTPQVARSLLDHRQNFFQITLDGWREVHDTTRQRADGCATFETIWNNLQSLKQLRRDFSCLIRVHLRPDNLESVEDLCAQIRQTLVSVDQRFAVDFHPIQDMGGEGGKTVQPWDIEKLHRVERKLRSIVDGVSEAQVNDANPREPFICYASKPNSLVIRSNGRIGKCTVVLNEPRNDVGQLNEDGTIEINQVLFNQWVGGFETLNAAALACPAIALMQSATPGLPGSGFGATWK